MDIDDARGRDRARPIAVSAQGGRSRARSGHGAEDPARVERRADRNAGAGRNSRSVHGGPCKRRDRCQRAGRHAVPNHCSANHCAAVRPGLNRPAADRPAAERFVGDPAVAPAGIRAFAAVAPAYRPTRGSAAFEPGQGCARRDHAEPGWMKTATSLRTRGHGRFSVIRWCCYLSRTERAEYGPPAAAATRRLVPVPTTIPMRRAVATRRRTRRSKASATILAGFRREQKPDASLCIRLAIYYLRRPTRLTVHHFASRAFVSRREPHRRSPAAGADANVRSFAAENGPRNARHPLSPPRTSERPGCLRIRAACRTGRSMPWPAPSGAGPRAAIRPGSG